MKRLNSKKQQGNEKPKVELVRKGRRKRVIINGRMMKPFEKNGHEFPYELTKDVEFKSLPGAENCILVYSPESLEDPIIKDLLEKFNVEFVFRVIDEISAEVFISYFEPNHLDDTLDEPIQQKRLLVLEESQSRKEYRMAFREALQEKGLLPDSLSSSGPIQFTAVIPGFEIKDMHKHLLKLFTELDRIAKQKWIRPHHVLLIRKETDEFGWMSMLSPHPINYKGVQYKNCEELFQCLRFEQYPKIQKEIMNSDTAIDISQKHKAQLKRIGMWDFSLADKEKMELCIKLKLEQHPELKKKLLDTKAYPIVEDSANHITDTSLIWGGVKIDGNWMGENIIGKIWMDFRRKLREGKNI